MKENKLDQLLKQHLDFENLDESAPSSPPAAARLLIMKRKKAPDQRETDLFSLIAAFLNMRIRLYHAVIATVLIGAGVLVLTRNDTAVKSEPPSFGPVSNLAAAHNATVLSSIQTFVLHK